MIFLFILVITGTYNVNGNTAPTLNLPGTVSVDENSAPGLTVFTATGTDVDVGDTLTYSATYTTAGGAAIFDVDSASGAVSLSLSTQLNYENLSPKVYDVEIFCSDGTAGVSGTLKITVADVDETPTFSQQGGYTLSVDEGPVTTVFPSSNFGVTDPEGAVVTHTLDCTAYSSYFTINATSGDISYAQTYDVDASGTPSSVTCTVTASDGALSNTASLVIYVNNVNDNTPTFAVNTYTFLLEAADSIGTVIGVVTATDDDIGLFGSFTYAVDTSGLAADYFGVTSTGQIYVKLALSAYSGTGATFIFDVTATDTAGLSGTAAVTAVITVTTTVTTTTTTDRYLTFFEDTNSIVWFSAVMLACVGLLVLSTVFMWRYKVCHKLPQLLNAIKCPSMSSPVRPSPVAVPERPPLRQLPNPPQADWAFWSTSQGFH